MAFMSLSIRSFSQDKALLARADSLHQLGRDLFTEQKYEDAIALFEEAAVIRKEQLGKYVASYANCLYNISISYSQLDDYAHTLEYGLQALEIREKVLGREHPVYARNLYNVAIAYSKMDDYNKALEYHQ